jgi:hypothetical protein
MGCTHPRVAGLALGADVGAEGLNEKPRRMAGAYVELPTPHPFLATTFPDARTRQEFLALTSRSHHEP